MPALLFLLHRCRARLDLFARADLVSIPPAVLLQWAQLACPKTHRRRDRLYACRQRLCAHRRLAAGADVGRSALARRAPPHPRSLCQAVLSGVRRLRSVLPLELHARCSGFVAAPIYRHWRAGPRPSTLKLHVNRVIITAPGNRGRTAHSGFAVSEAGEKVVDCAGMPLTTARRANSAGIESIGDLAKGREPGSLDRSSSRPG